ncbi:hypothetical protein SAMN05444521_4795 [Streptomyces sp. 3214.6]|nr:hypothetical protein SAMN05444521_4795 [Streptomyces sp. 3214.6]
MTTADSPAPASPATVRTRHITLPTRQESPV